MEYESIFARFHKIGSYLIDIQTKVVFCHVVAYLIPSESPGACNQERLPICRVKYFPDPDDQAVGMGV
jgi:hypothetical protein